MVEETLPAAFGGGATDYQIVESDEDGVRVVTLVVSPGVGTCDEARLKATVVDRLGAGGASARMMANRWREADTLRVVRREPHATPAGKVLALHVTHAHPPGARRRDTVPVRRSPNRRAIGTTSPPSGRPAAMGCGDGTRTT